jgi:GAF domain-containing protein
MTIASPSANNQQPGRTGASARLWNHLTGAHSSITEIGARRQAQLAAISAIGIAFLLLFGAIADIILQKGLSFQDYILIGATILTLVAYFLARSPFYPFGAWLTIASFTALGYVLAFSNPALVTNHLNATIPVLFVLTSILLPLGGLIFMVAANFLTVSLLPLLIPAYTFVRSTTDAGNYLTLGILLIIGVAFRNAIERHRLNEVRSANRELTAIQGTLEQRVEERTSELSQLHKQAERRAGQLLTVSEVARSIASIPDPDVMLPSIARIIADRFGYYHIGIFMIDAEGEYAVLRASNSDGGQRMLARNHKLRVGETGIVGYVAERGAPRIARDVGADAVFFANPDLPDTRSELALPLTISRAVIGVLDVQSTEPSAFTQEDVSVLSALADQVAVAIQNARLFSDTRKALEEVEEVSRRYVRQQWNRTRLPAQFGYMYSGAEVNELGAPLDAPEVETALEYGELVNFEKRSTLAIPLKLRGETIGVINVRPDSDRRRIWSQDEINAIQTIADRAIVTLENARLLEDAMRRASKERTIAEISARIGALVDVDELLQMAASELGRVIPDAEVAVQFSNVKATEEGK